MHSSFAAPISRRTPNGPTPVTPDRRNRTRLRDLCDEVLASFRIASDRDLFSDADRREGQALISRIASTTV